MLTGENRGKRRAQRRALCFPRSPRAIRRCRRVRVRAMVYSPKTWVRWRTIDRQLVFFGAPTCSRETRGRSIAVGATAPVRQNASLVAAEKASFPAPVAVTTKGSDVAARWKETRSKRLGNPRGSSSEHPNKSAPCIGGRSWVTIKRADQGWMNFYTNNFLIAMPSASSCPIQRRVPSQAKRAINRRCVGPPFPQGRVTGTCPLDYPRRNARAYPQKYQDHIRERSAVTCSSHHLLVIRITLRPASVDDLQQAFPPRSERDVTGLVQTGYVDTVAAALTTQILVESCSHK